MASKVSFEAGISLVAAFPSTYRDAHYTDLKIGIEGDRAFASWTFSGTNQDGTGISYRGVDLFHFEDDLIALKDAYRKERSLPIG